MNEAQSMTIAEWRDLGIILEHGDTGRTIWTDVKILYTVFIVRGEHWYVTHIEDGESFVPPDRPAGVHVQKAAFDCWCDDSGRALHIVGDGEFR